MPSITRPIHTGSISLAPPLDGWATGDALFDVPMPPARCRGCGTEMIPGPGERAPTMCSTCERTGR